MNDVVTIKIPISLYETLLDLQSELWKHDEESERYSDAVTCGNADDTFASGNLQGKAELANDILLLIQ